MDDDGYPETSALEEIKSYDLIKKKTVKPLIDLIKDNWKYIDIGYLRIRKGKNSLGKPCMKLQLHTGGWSGNEDIIDAITFRVFQIKNLI